MESIDMVHLAHLARIHLSKEDEDHIAKSFGAILEYVSKLQEVDTTGIEARPYLTDVNNVWRDDEIIDDSTVRNQALKNFPKTSGTALEVPAIFE